MRKTTCPRPHSGKEKCRIDYRSVWRLSPGFASSSLLFPPKFSGRLQDLLLPQNQFAMFLYCFIFIHVIYVAKEMTFFLFSKHYLFCIAAILLCLIKTLWSYFQVPWLSPSLGISVQESYWDMIQVSPRLPAYSLLAPPSLTCASRSSEPALRKGSAVNHLHLIVKKPCTELHSHCG